MQVVPFDSLSGQLRLHNSRLLVVGCGGLGSAALLYLASAGIGCIGLLDHDRVEVSNLHRQIIHDTNTVGWYKTESASRRMKAINPNIDVVCHTEFLSNDNSVQLFENYDLVLDCTDNPITKYLISDTCVVVGIPLVSASAVQTSGQLIILNFNNGPCYRCIHPVPTRPENIATCADNGVIGSCVGLVGTLMATESIKVLTNYYNAENPYKPVMLMYSGYQGNDGESLKSFKMRGKQQSCLCSSMTIDTIKSINYTQFCGAINYDLVEEKYRITFDEITELSGSPEKVCIVDVRPTEQFNIANFGEATEDKGFPPLLNIPYKTLVRLDDEALQKRLPPDVTIVSVCKMGNDSRLATKHLRDKGYIAYDLKGGLNEYSQNCDFNVYW